MDKRRHRGPHRPSVRPVSEVWALPGYDVQAVLGYGGCGEVWRAVELASGEPVALKRLRADADPAAVAALRREATVQARLDTPYVVRLRAVLGEDASTVLVLDLAQGGSLAALLGWRGRLDPSEIVTLAAPLAQALAAVHAEGLVHGDLTPSSVLFTAAGMPLLADLGLARLRSDTGEARRTARYVDPVVAAGGLPTAASDVWAVGALCHHALAGTPPYGGERGPDVLRAAPRSLVAAIASALQADPAARPSASELATALRRAHAAAPLRLAPAEVAPGLAGAADLIHAGAEAAPSACARWMRRTQPRLVAAVLAAGLVTPAALGGWFWGRGAAPDDASLAAPAMAAAPAADPSPPLRMASSGWRRELEHLDRLRADALEAADPDWLREVYAEQSTPLATDVRLVEGLRDRGRRAVGVRHVLLSVTVRSVSAGSVRLEVEDRLSSYDVIDSAGKVVEHVEGRPAARWHVELTRAGTRWRIRQINRF